jgi:flagellar assembly protein FliH
VTAPKKPATSFLFDRDFGSSRGMPSAKEQAARDEADQSGYRRGLAEGRAQAAAETNARLNDCMRRIADAAGQLLQQADARARALEDETLAFALSLARKIAGEALSQYPLATIEQIAHSAFGHLRGVPHLVVRVNDGLVEDVETLVKRIARERGFDGRIVTMGEPEIAPGDARFEWADGGIAREAARIGDTAQTIAAA